MLKSKKVIILLLLVLLFIPFTLATISNFGIYKQGQDINLIQICASCTYNNITTVLYPNSTIAVSGVGIEMTDNGGVYNYTLSGNYTMPLGQYLVNGVGDEGGVKGEWNYYLIVNSTGKAFSGMDVSVYIFFLLVCLTVMIFSFRLVKNNTMIKDEITSGGLYELKKRSELKFYLELLKKKMWIVGVFGIYLSILMFISFFSQLIFTLGILEINMLLVSIVEVMSWGLIPFILFWIVYIIIFIYKSTEDSLRHQFGKDTWRTH